MEIFVIRDGEQTGPFDEGTVQALLSKGGARPEDLAWRKGLERWLPLSEVLDPRNAGTGDSRGLPPSQDVSAAPENRPGREPATAKQKAFLKYLGAEFSDSIGREKAALAICDLLESPKAQSRIRKWQDEKLRLHPDIFQDEIDLRKANRATRYLELVQTDGAEVLKDVTKAHVQVLVESLDKRHPNWESEPRAALWDYLFPSIGDHFPQLVQSAYKGRLRVGGTLRAAEPAAGSLAGGTRSMIPPPAAPGTLAAMWRGVLYGVIALGTIVGGIYGWQQWQARPAKPEAAAPVPAEPAKTEAAPAASQPKDAAASELAETPPVAPLESPAVTPPPPDAPAAEPPMTAEKPAPTEEKPAAAMVPPAPPEPTEPAPPAPAPPPPPRTEVTLLQGIGVALPNGQVNLPAGTRLKYLALEGPNVRVAWNNSVFYVPALATDVGNSPPAPPAVAPQPSNVPAPSMAPAPAPAKKPSDDL